MTSRQKSICCILAIPVLYGLLFRILFGMNPFTHLLAVMSVGFLVGIPFSIGVLTIWLSPVKKIQRFGYRFFMPWVPVLCFFLITLLFSIEGWACWIMIMPVFLLLASLGGLIAGHYRWKRYKHEHKLNVSIVVLLPFVLSSVEKTIDFPPRVFTAFTQIDIQAGREEIWQNVVRVKAIHPEEDRGWLTDFLNFPRPIRAELDYAGVGGSREAIFTKGLVFHEQVLDYSEGRSMHFSIKANPYEIPSTTMDKHIVIGGDYFDVLDGTYELEPLGNGWRRLHLYSHFILHTDFNGYAGWWARLIMMDIQNNILQVIRERCEEGKLRGKQ